MLAIEETGANMLFWYLDFLSFQTNTIVITFLPRPLISIPVSMSKRDIGGNQIFSLQYSEDDLFGQSFAKRKTKNGLLLVFA